MQFTGLIALVAALSGVSETFSTLLDHLLTHSAHRMLLLVKSKSLTVALPPDALEQRAASLTAPFASPTLLDAAPPKPSQVPASRNKGAKASPASLATTADSLSSHTTTRVSVALSSTRTKPPVASLTRSGSAKPSVKVASSVLLLVEVAVLLAPRDASVRPRN